jgi:tRNA nucleotidyltransferase/poly(A) polymerase
MGLSQATSIAVATPIGTPPNVIISRVMDAMERAGYQAYLVGGSIRDLLLDREPKDWDVATDALPSDVRSLFERTSPSGEKYGTVTVLGDIPVEVATFRVPGSCRAFGLSVFGIVSSLRFSILVNILCCLA